MRRFARRVRDWVLRQRVRAHATRWRISPQSTLTVFMYHRVTEAAERDWGPWRYAVTPDTFQDHISSITDQYNIVTMDTVLDAIEGAQTLPERGAVLTFDDGYTDTRSKALPTLERYGIPATVYVSTALIGAAGPFVFRLAHALDAQDANSIQMPAHNSLPETLPSDTQAAYEQIRRLAKWESENFRERILDTVEAGIDQPQSLMLTADEVSELANSDLITVGAHGHEHLPLTTLSLEYLRRNVTASVNHLERILGSPPDHFSYPYGAHDDQVRRVVADTGFKTAVTTRARVAQAATLDATRYTIPRIDRSIYPV